jgi:6,7-dimethyl-8-ribityllumazine synthase
MSTHAPKSVSGQLAANARVAIVAARFNGHIVDELLNGCRQRLGELKVSQDNVEVHHVPGAFELPLAAKMLAQTRKFDAVICLGCVIRGETPHFEYVAGQCAAGIQWVAVDQNLPVIFGVLTTNTEEQARDRIGGKHGHAGVRAADAAAEMVQLARDVRKRAAPRRVAKK